MRLQAMKCEESKTCSLNSTQSKHLNKSHKPLVLQPPLVRARFAVSQPGDKYEEEADRVAEKVMQMPAGASLQRKCAECSGDEKELLQPGMLPGQLEFTPVQDLPSSVNEVLHSSGQPLDPAIRVLFEPRFGYNFGQVRVHTDSKAAGLARAYNARAFTLGRDVVFSAGEYTPESEKGRNLIAHELTHVVQQGRTNARTTLSENTAIDVHEVPGAELVMRACRTHPEETYYQRSARYCLDSTFSPRTHPGKRCYREIPRRSSYFDCPPGEHVCFDSDGACEDSPDVASPAEGKESNGTCNWSAWCVAEHTARDFVPAIDDEYIIRPGARALQQLEREMYRRMFPMPF